MINDRCRGCGTEINQSRKPTDKPSARIICDDCYKKVMDTKTAQRQSSKDCQACGKQTRGGEFMYIKELIEKRLDEVQRKEERTKTIIAELEQDLTNRSLELTKVQEEKKELEKYLKE